MKLQAMLLKELKDLDCLAWSNNATGFGMRGLPDVTIVCYDLIFFVEVKDERTKDKLSKLQEYRIKQLEDYGHDVFICRSKSDINIIKNIIEHTIEHKGEKNEQ